MSNGISYSHGCISVYTAGYELKNATIGIDFYRRVRTVSTEWKLLGQQDRTWEDAAGHLEGLQLLFETPEKLLVEWNGGLYEGTNTFACWMRVENKSSSEAVLSSLVPLCVRGLDGGAVITPEISNTRAMMLNNGKWMGDARSLHVGLDPRRVTESYHISAFMDTENDKALVFGMGERTNTIVRLEGSLNRAGFEMGICGSMETDLFNGAYHLAPGKAFGMNRVVVMQEGNVWETFDAYGDYLAKYMKIDSQRIRSATGIFSVYGQEKADTDDWENIALTDERVSELMDVLDRYVKPYGIEYVKTQFGGASSGPSFKDTGRNVFWRRDWAGKEPMRPIPEGESLAELIEREGFTPDTCNLAEYHPHGVKYMCDMVHQRGYKNALVCRGYLNIISGSDERENISADIWEMAVKKWGYDYLMFDFNLSDFETDRNDVTVAEAMTKRFQTIRNRVGPEVYIEACMIMPGCILGLADGYRPTSDWRGGTEEELVGKLTSMYFLHNKVFAMDSEFFDPDITPFVWGNEGKINNRIRFFGSLERVRSWTTWCGLSGYNLFTGGVIDDVSAERWNIFTRMLPVHQGPCAKPLDLCREQHPSIWKLEGMNAGGKYTTVAYFNWNSLAQKCITIDYAQMGLSLDKRYIAKSFWDGRVYELYDGMTVVLPASGCLLLTIRKLGCDTAPILIGTDRHVTEAFGMKRFEYDAASKTIIGECEAPANTQMTVFIYMPDNRGPEYAEGCEWEISQPGVIRVTATMNADGAAKWLLKMDSHKKII